ncbi:MAG: DHH family phosphoesterase [Candidatus Bathyarchaeota archaeon]|nr:DHH family phosphoesterase [Candidatus Bathyarchaeota archaeon]
MDISALRDHLRGKVSIICHHNADPDAIGAAYAIQRLITVLDPKAVTEILYPDSASQLSEGIIQRFSIGASNRPKIIGGDTVVVVDAGSLIQLESLTHLVKDAETRIFIDHHGRDPEIERLATLYISDESAVATCEIVFNIWVGLGFEPPKEVAEVLLLGMVFDSKHFGLGTPGMFRVVARLMDLGATLNGARDLLQASMDSSERIARLKSAQRATIYRVDTWLIATANLGSFQASAARGIMNLGADVAIIAGNDKESLKASFRSTEEFHAKTGIHIGDDVTKPLAELYGGAGGGHPTAAGVNGVGDSGEFLIKAVEYLAEKMGKRPQIL